MIRIHYIEDNLIDQRALMREVQKYNLPYQIDLSSSLTEARERTQHYDLILCDYFLSDGTILDILPSLIDHTPVIVLTGQADLNNAVTALKLGAKDYLVKDPERQYLSILPIQIDNLIWNQQIERDRRWLSTLLFSISGAIPFGIYLYEPETGKVAYANKAFFTLWNLAHNEDQPVSYTHTQISGHISMMVEPDSVGG
ncbi:MAG: response regulator, partial [Methanospirillum sp.]|uniref:response regulator n=1 Tax=Methanospirillum sp. TaxID=45200 RepID=UPI002371F703